MALTDHQTLNTTTPAFDVELRYFVGPAYAPLARDGFGTVFAGWDSPDDLPDGWTEITNRVAYASSFSHVWQGNSLSWTAELSGWDYDDSLFGLGLTLVCWRRFWRPTGNDPTYGSNLTTNGGFESFTGTADNGVSDTFSGWENTGVSDGSGNRIEASTTAYSGTAAKLTNTSNAVWLTQYGPTTTPGKTYRLSLRTRGDSTHAGAFTVRDPSNNAYLALNVSTGVTSTAWQLVTFDFVAPVGCTQVYVTLLNLAGGTVYFDDVAVQEVIPETAPAGWQSWARFFVGQIVAHNNRNNYLNGKSWRRSVTGANAVLTQINAPRVTAGRINVMTGATASGSPPLTTVQEEQDTGEFVGGRATVGFTNLVDGNRNTVYISEIIPQLGTPTPWPNPIWDGGVVTTELFIKPYAGWSLERAWWVEVFNMRSQDAEAEVGFQCAVWENGAPVYWTVNLGDDWDQAYKRKWPKLQCGKSALFVANRAAFDECAGNANGAAFIADISQFSPARLSLDAAVYAGNQIIAWAPGGAVRHYAFPTPLGGTAHFDGATLNSSLLTTGQSWWSATGNGVFTANNYPHPGGNNTGVGPVNLRVLLNENVSLTLDQITASSTTIRLDNYRCWLIPPPRGGESFGVDELGHVFGWGSRDANGLHDVRWINAPATPVPAGTRCYPYANNNAQTGYPLTSTSLVRRKTPLVQDYRVYWSSVIARGYEQSGWQQDYYTHFHQTQGNTQSQRLTDTCGDGTNSYLWVRTILYLIDAMSDGGRVKLNEIEAELAQLALDLDSTAALDGQNSSSLAQYLWNTWAGLALDDFIDESAGGLHRMGQHALAITAVNRVLDDLAGATGCLVDYAPTGGVLWRDNPWWPKNKAASIATFQFSDAAVRNDIDYSRTPAEVDYLVLNALSLEGEPHSLRVVYPTPLGTTEPPVWAIVREVNDKVVACDADGQLVAQMELEKLVLSNRRVTLAIKGIGEWARAGLRVGLTWDYSGTGRTSYQEWLIESVRVATAESNGQRNYETTLVLTGFRT